MPPQLAASAAAIRASVFAELQPRIAAHAARGGRLAPLHIGDTHRAPPEPARFALHADREEIDRELYRYGPIGGLPSLREACAEVLARTRRARPAPTAANVVIATGATHALFCAARVLFDPGDEVLVATPCWPLAPGVLAAAGARAVEVPLGGRHRGDVGRNAAGLLEEARTSRTRGLYLITPNNPDGSVLSQKALEAIAAFARRRDLWVIADEVYADYTYDAPHVSIGMLDGMAERTVTAYSFSKSHALAGARVGLVAGPAEVVEAAVRVATHTGFNVPLIAQRVALAALATGDGWVDAARDEYRQARDLAAAALAGTAVRFPPAEGGSYLFLDLADLLDGRPLRAFLEAAIDHGVLLAPGAACGVGFERCARLCFTAVPRVELTEAMAGLRAAIDAFARGS